MKTRVISAVYKNIAKPVLFSIDAEAVHNAFTFIGNSLGKSETGRNTVKSLFGYENPVLVQKIGGVKFKNPIGLAAGFDYNAKLTQILPSVGFGFSTIGTVTNLPYEGNPAPRLGRMSKSSALLVNKGFKSAGADKVIENLKGVKFENPVGVSIGRSNSPTLTTLDQSIKDIVECFTKFEKAKIGNSYYEMNISCPNLIHGSQEITFYPPRNLEKLLSRLDRLRLKKPLFVKMPISEDNKSFEAMLRVIAKHKVAGIIVGNLMKDRKNPAFEKEEIASAGVGNFSGKPCQKRSNELIGLAYRKFGGKLIIIGCGGVFDPRDAYEKIKLGSSLIMMITGMVFEGPQVVGKINKDLAMFLKNDGYKNLSEAVGAYYKF